MDFICGLPTTSEGFDAIWVLVDRLTKVARFLPYRMVWPVERLAELYFQRIFPIHGMPMSIISDRDSRFLSGFWKSLMRHSGTRLSYSSAYHPQTDGQTERVNQILEDMLRACILDFQGSWKKYLPYAEFAYNNSYQQSIEMAPYDALYGARCRTPLFWHDAVGPALTGGELVTRSADVVRQVQERLRAAQSRQKALADRHRRPLDLEVG